MTMTRYQQAIRTSALLLVSACGFKLMGAPAAPARDLPAPPFTEVYGVVRSNVTGLTEAELNRAAVHGLLSQLQSRATLVTNATRSDDAPAVPLVVKSALFDGGYGYLRIGRVAPGLSNELVKAYEQVRGTNKLKGLVIDLRYAVGQDYMAAAQSADLFFKSEQPLLNWGSMVVRSTPKSHGIDLPMVILINHNTSGAAEALAAALRQTEGSLVIGSPSAGHAYLYKDVPLSNGELLRVASGEVSNGSGQPLPRTGLEPDIRITVNPEDEKAFFEDPYRVAAKPFAQAARPGTNELASSQSTNRLRRRLNEAELVRMQREGADLEAEASSAAAATGGTPVITDPALSRGLDLLKGLALAYRRR
jgi:hypothetical protein